MGTNGSSKYLASDDKPHNDLCEVTTCHVKAHAILSDDSFYSNSMIENIYWKYASAKFDEFINEDDVFNKFVGKMFWVWDENHRLQAWRFFIDKHHYCLCIL